MMLMEASEAGLRNENILGKRESGSSFTFNKNKTYMKLMSQSIAEDLNTLQEYKDGIKNTASVNSLDLLKKSDPMPMEASDTMQNKAPVISLESELNGNDEE